MVKRYGKKRNKHNVIFFTVLTAVVLCCIFLSIVSFFYNSADDEAYENLHVQTKQIKDDLVLQLVSDRENLTTMANFASKLIRDGEELDLLFESFKPIGLVEAVAVLLPDNTFVTKNGTVELTGHISFEEEAAKGSYISSVIDDVTKHGVQHVRSAVPIKLDDKTVGILYGSVNHDAIMSRYKEKVTELNAQLFVYDKRNGDLIIDTIHNFEEGAPDNMSFLKDRKYNDGYSYEQIMNSPNGFSSFRSVYNKGEDLYIHYSTIDEFDWMIMLARYDSQVFAKTHQITKFLINSFCVMLCIIALYVLYIMGNERRANKVMACASKVRKLLLEINTRDESVAEALEIIGSFSKSRTAILFDTDGELYKYSSPEHEKISLYGDERNLFVSELLKYSSELYRLNKASINVISLRPTEHLLKTNEDLYQLFKKYSMNDVTFAAIVSKNNHISVVGVINPMNKRGITALLSDIAACFSIAFYNKRHLNKTKIAATTDSLTGALNRISYNKDVKVFDEQKPENFCCIYVDVNELHSINNKLGHAGGDEMLIYIANKLKEIFFGHKVYRLGGDEFLVFAQNTTLDVMKKNTDTLNEQLEKMNYYVSLGISYRTLNANTEEMVREAELKMYEDKALYYQKKECMKVTENKAEGFVSMHTGVPEIDATLSVIKEKYNGIYRVNLDTDKVTRVLMPAYLGYRENEENFSELVKRYVEDAVNPEYHRPVFSFLNYEAFKKQLKEGVVPRISFKRLSGETVVLSIYKLDDDENSSNNTLWVFAKE